MARRWIITSPQGANKELVAPTVFTVLSTQGNQWRKLMWFYEDWQNCLNPLLSMHDLFVTDKGIFEELQHGFMDHVKRFMRRAVAHAAKAATKPGGEAYHWYLQHYLERLDPEALPDFSGLLLLDSGGFVLGQPDRWARMKSVRNGPGADVADLMARLHHWEQQGERPAEYLETGEEAQQLVLEAGLVVKPDILVTLDRVIHYEMPALLKEWYVEFNIRNAQAVLRHKAAHPGRQPMYWAVLHPVGPALSEIKGGKLDRAKVVESYYRGYRQQLEALRQEELRLGVTFDGFGLGSLVPVSDSSFLAIIGEAAHRALVDTAMADRPLHAFGSTEPKARRLQQYGISSFDSTHHIVRGRNRQAYNPVTGVYERMSNALQCGCPVCTRHRSTELDELQEDRKGVKEVATVLLALHNYHTNEQAHLAEMRQVEEERYPS